jgi:hypothetical protein
VKAEASVVDVNRMRQRLPAERPDKRPVGRPKAANPPRVCAQCGETFQPAVESSPSTRRTTCSDACKRARQGAAGGTSKPRDMSRLGAMVVERVAGRLVTRRKLDEKGGA